MWEINLIQRLKFTELKAIMVIVGLFFVAACSPPGFPQQDPTATATLQTVDTATPAPTATEAPTQTPTPEPPAVADTPTPTATAPVPTVAPTDTPVLEVAAAPPPTEETPLETETPVPLMGATEATAFYHDADIIDVIVKYRADVSPWLDLLVRLDDGSWYGPERNDDAINALPLPEGYRWETEGSFETLPNGEAWWAGPGVEGTATLIGPDGSGLITLHLEVAFY